MIIKSMDYKKMLKATNTSFLKQEYFTIFKISYLRFAKLLFLLPACRRLNKGNRRRLHAGNFFLWVKNLALSCLFFPLRYFIHDELCCEHCLGFHRAGGRDVFTWKLILINSVIIQLHK